MSTKAGRNDPCACGSGKKFKRCCGLVGDPIPAASTKPDAANDKKELAARNWSLAVQHYQSGRSAAAREACLQIVACDAGHADAHHLLGLLSFDAGAFEEAERSVANALKAGDSAAYRNTLCVVLTAKGDYAKACAQAERALQLQPHYAEAHYNLGYARQLSGELRAALASYGRAIECNPRYKIAHSARGDVCLSLGDTAFAIDAYQKAIDLDPTFAEAHNNLGNAWRKQCNLDRASECYKQAIHYKPHLAQAHRNLGSVLAEQGHWREAVASYYRALDLQPAFIEAHCELADVFARQGRTMDARARLELAIALRPHSSLALRCLAKWLLDQPDVSGRLDRLQNAQRCLEQAIEYDPNDATNHLLMAGMFKKCGQLQAAVQSCRVALTINPLSTEAHNNLGTLLQELGDWEGAVACYSKSLELDPNCAEAQNNIGNAYKQRGDLRAAATAFERALELRPAFSEALSNLALVRELQGDVHEAMRCHERALALNPHSASAYSAWLFAHAYTHADDENLPLIASRFESACVPALELSAAPSRRLPRSRGRLRVGYVSGDFREHPVTCFIEPVLAHHDRARIELFAYSTHPQTDSVTERIKQLTDHWISAYGLSDAQLRDRIVDDGIDVLIDLSGHTAHNRLPALARRAAPVQAHYLGYFATTGLSAMDYWLGDEVLCPKEVDAHFVEKLWRLPRVSVAYAGREGLPVSQRQTAGHNDVWLGSFNKIIKINAATLKLWSELMCALPNAKLLLKTKELGDAENRRRILESFAAAGISGERVHLDDASATRSWEDHMRSYDRLDIVLDPIGSWGGNTTTCDALWMGAPVVTLLGRSAPERMTAAMLTAMGREEWVAQSHAEYIEKVIALARDDDRRAQLRSEQRAVMQRSPLCDARGLARCLEDAYQEMFALCTEERKRKSA